MQIIIPMSGIGKRFIEAGYKDPKPLINVDGFPIIEHVVNLFPDENNITFICNSTHLKETEMRQILKRIAPYSKIVEIPNHKKGPVYAVSHIFDSIDDEDEVIVNYCDFSKFWNYKDFLNHTRARNADGAIPAYKGFHPHMLGSTNYAFMRSEKQWMLEIQEKKPFTSNRMEEYASDGTYYFKKGAFVKKYFKKLMEMNLDLNGEFYVSMVYNLLVTDALKVSIYEIQHMLQWGTPQDLDEYNRWSAYFKNIIQFEKSNIVNKRSINLIPLAGRGLRFLKEGYSLPKPLVEVSGKPMILQASFFLPESEKRVFLCLGEHLMKFPLEKFIRGEYENSEIISVNGVTEGQACTVEIGLKNENLDASLFIGASDNGMIIDNERFQRYVNDESVDAVVFTFRNHPSAKRNPEMYGWVIIDENDYAKDVSVKKQISDNPSNDHAIVGAFYFKKVKYYLDGFADLYKNNIRVNNEFYVDSIIGVLARQGLRIKVFEVKDYICWGTPNDLRTYEYWQSFFSKCNWHPYKIENDPMMEKGKVNDYNNKFNVFSQENV